ncbi:MAG TPA: T9SS type A sorting domain-containing protein, partial [Bacteroidetes bacterium]|nr:T9SS type A sorting domain-containing protein [Bacteroidota bacterium]
NLPTVPANCVVYQAGSDNGVYLGTDAGVYYRDDNLTDWVDYSNGLPFARVMELEINPLANRLRAATYGRSMWESDLYGLGCLDDLVLAGPLSGTQLIEANNTIISTNTITAGADITFSAGVSITLNSGFNTVLGSVFNAVMDGCTSGKVHATPISGTYEPPIVAPLAGEAGPIEGFEVSNFPNPFRNRTWVSYKLADAAPVRIEVYNMAAQRVAILVDEPHQDAGVYTVSFQASSLPAGQYIARFIAGNHVSYLKMAQLQ